MKNDAAKFENLITGGLILLILGAFFLGKWTGLISVHNGWAIIFWIPAISSFGNVLHELRRHNGINFAVISGVSGILFPIAISIGFFLNVNWLAYAPILVVVAGIILFQTGFIKSNEPVGKLVADFRLWIFSAGLAVIGIGVLFLVSSIRSQNGNPLSINWFGIPFFICALGGFLFTKQLIIKANRSNFFIAANLFVALTFFTISLLALFGYQVNLSGAAIILAIYIAILVSAVKTAIRIRDFK
jgi:hypothetical protein